MEKVGKSCRTTSKERREWIEKRSDVMLSTLRKYIEAMGGSLNLIAQFPDRPPVEITAFSDTAAQE